MFTPTRLLIAAALSAGCAISPLTAAESDSPSEAEAAQAEADAKVISDYSMLIGQSMGQHIVDNELDVEAVIAGLRKTIAGEPLPDQQAGMALQKAFQEAQARPLQGLSDKIIAETDIATPGPQWKEQQGLPASVHDQFYKDFIAMEGVQKTDSGIAYQVIKAGSGPKPSGPAAKVTVHYVGRHTTGEVFDSSVSRKETIDFPLNGVIPGWTEGVQLMPTGSTYRLVIPGELAYGPLQEGSPRPTGVLIFDVTLLKTN